jgi:hypothetical protein
MILYNLLTLSYYELLILYLYVSICICIYLYVCRTDELIACMITSSVSNDSLSDLSPMKFSDIFSNNIIYNALHNVFLTMIDVQRAAIFTSVSTITSPFISSDNEVFSMESLCTLSHVLKPLVASCVTTSVVPMDAIHSILQAVSNHIIISLCTTVVMTCIPY